jgi:predicted RecB family nuclease
VTSGKPRAALQEALPSTKLTQPEALPPLTSIKGVAEARARRLQAAGIRTISDLAQATPEQVAAALAGSPAVTAELVTGIIARAKAALAAQKPGS